MTNLPKKIAEPLMEKVKTANNLLALLRVVGPHCEGLFYGNRTDIDDFGRGIGAIANCACDLLASVEDELFELQGSSD